MGSDGEILRRKLRRERRVRRGLMVVCVLVVLLCIGSYFIKASHMWAGPVRAFSGPQRTVPSANAFKIERDEVHLVLNRGWVLILGQKVAAGEGALDDRTSETLLGWTVEASFSKLSTVESLFKVNLAGHGLAALPLWPLGVVGLGALPWLIARDRRLSRVGHCLRCGYDVRSLAASSVCPECGCADRV